MVYQVRRLLVSPLFQEWKAKNPEAYLTHIFYMTEMEPQVGYYDQILDKITTFTMADEITRNPEQQVFKKEDTIRPLLINDVEQSTMRIIEKARTFQEEKYKKENVVKEIILLQNLDIGQVYNVTFITDSFKILNMKICAKRGDVLQHEFRSLMDLGKKTE